MNDLYFKFFILQNSLGLIYLLPLNIESSLHFTCEFDTTSQLFIIFWQNNPIDSDRLGVSYNLLANQLWHSHFLHLDRNMILFALLTSDPNWIKQTFSLDIMFSFND